MKQALPQTLATAPKRQIFEDFRYGDMPGAVVTYVCETFDYHHRVSSVGVARIICRDNAEVFGFWRLKSTDSVLVEARGEG
jgi:hypothetical protein